LTKAGGKEVRHCLPFIDSGMLPSTDSKGVSMLLDDIIDALTNNESDLVDALLKTKRLLHAIGKKELSEWVNHELNGYSEKSEVPAYRIVGAQVKANCNALTFTAEAHPIPIGHLPKDQQDALQKLPMRESLAVVQELSTNESLRRTIPMEANGVLSRGLAKGVHVNSAWCQVEPTQLKSILTQVRSRLLDFALELRELVPSSGSEQDLKQQAKTADITGLFNNAVFGPGANIIIGDHNRQTVSSEVREGDFQSLAAVLSAVKVPAEEIKTLEAAIDKKGGDREGGVMRWLRGLGERAEKGTLSIGVDVVKETVTKAVLAYLGLG
jgi:AbiTii